MPPGRPFDAEAWAEALRRERKLTLEAFRDGRRSPYAAVARHDFAGEQWLELGAAEACAVRLEGLAARSARARVRGEQFELEALEPSTTFRPTGRDAPPAGPGPLRFTSSVRVELGRYVLRFSHQNHPAILVLDPQSPRLLEGPPPVWFDPDPAFRVEARLERDPAPREEVVLSTRGHRRRGLRLGALVFALEGAERRLTALRLLEPGVGEAAVSVFFRDRTTGHESYPVGRYVDPEALPGGGDRYLVDFNRAHNPSCAFSPLYNCPIPPRENVLDAAVRAGERDPAPERH